MGAKIKCGCNVFESEFIPYTGSHITEQLTAKICMRSVA